MQTPHLKPLIKKLHPSHLEEVYALEALCFDSPWSKKQFLDAMQSSIYILFGAFIQVNSKTNHSTKESLGAYLLITQVGDYAEILNIASHPDYRKKGLAKALLNAFFDTDTRNQNKVHHKEENMSTKPILSEIILEVRSKNIPAQALYKQFEFVPIHTRKNYYKDDDAIVMQRKI